jgi:hypothetical protein
MQGRNADSVVVHSETGVRYFTKPLERYEPFHEVVDYVRGQELGMHGATDVKYAQTRQCLLVIASWQALILTSRK